MSGDEGCVLAGTLCPPRAVTVQLVPPLPFPEVADFLDESFCLGLAPQIVDFFDETFRILPTAEVVDFVDQSLCIRAPPKFAQLCDEPSKHDYRLSSWREQIDAGESPHRAPFHGDHRRNLKFPTGVFDRT